MSMDKVPPTRLAHAIEAARHYLLRLHQKMVPAPVAMSEMVLAGWTAQAITAAADLAVADALSDGPLHSAELARRVDADPDALDRLMRALVSCGVFRQRRDGRYQLNGLGATLQSTAAVSLAGAARFYGSPEHREHWSSLTDSIRTGETVVPAMRGMDFFAYAAANPEFGDKFNQAMTSVSELALTPVVAAYDFRPYRTIVDVGGGYGRLLAAILAATPTARGVLYDLPAVVANAPQLLTERHVADRVEVIAGSFFDRIPAGGDAYVLKHIIHDWPDEAAVQILRNVREAAGTAARVLLVEFGIPRHNREFIGKWTDLEMLLCAGARERTEPEFARLFGRAGLELTRVVQTASPFSVVEARPA
ncbi:MAG TPA: methyltransferase [Mycobacterium sp.]|nr:methyltransferase [Mycobacterium sp.]